jgi:hypothetical protein
LTLIILRDTYLFLSRVGFMNTNCEAHIQNIVKLEASKKGCKLWRNNVGAVHSVDGHFMRFGLANESKNVNSVIKSGDLIGIRPVIITPDMIGQTIGQFISREIKKSNWKYTGTEREQAQLRWIKLINSLGGDACFATSEGTL